MTPHPDEQARELYADKICLCPVREGCFNDSIWIEGSHQYDTCVKCGKWIIPVLREKVLRERLRQAAREEG